MWIYIISAIPLLVLWLINRRPDETSSITGISNEEDIDGGNDPEKSEKFDNLLNFRDVGKSINSIVGKKLVAENALFRSARLDDITIADRRRLRLNYGIKTVVDLRTKTEHKVQQQRRQARLRDPVAVESNKAFALPVQISGINYMEVNIQGRKFERNMLRKMSVWGFLKMAILMIFGYRLEGVSILVKEVMQPRGLNGLAYDTLDFCGTEITDLFNALAEPATYPVVIHCTQGKDRTGAIIALILLLLEIPISAITEDYRMSERELLPEQEIRLREMRELGLSEDFAGCPEDWIEMIEGHLSGKYGGVRGYLKNVGVDGEVQERIVERLRG